VPFSYLIKKYHYLTKINIIFDIKSKTLIKANKYYFVYILKNFNVACVGKKQRNNKKIIIEKVGNRRRISGGFELVKLHSKFIQ
jgi:hypothetical protein